jgi:ribosomal-protein-alanine N-acetyltransferase
VIQIDPAPVEAAETLARIHAEAFAPPWTAGEIVTLTQGLGAFAFLARFEAEPAGFILCRVAADEGEVLTIATRPEFRRRGVAKALLGAAEAAALDAGACRLFLEVADANPGALALYDGRGFRPVGRRHGYYSRGAGEGGAIIMRLDLNR